MISIYKNEAILRIIDIAEKANIEGNYVPMDVLRQRVKDYLSDSLILYYRFIEDPILDGYKISDRDMFLSSKCDAHIDVALSRRSNNARAFPKCYVAFGWSSVNNSSAFGKESIAYQNKIVSLVEEIENFLMQCDFIDP
jgi:hypothetical protein